MLGQVFEFFFCPQHGVLVLFVSAGPCGVAMLRASWSLLRSHMTGKLLILLTVALAMVGAAVVIGGLFR